MADLTKIISVNIDDNASSGLNKVDQNLTKVTQSTKTLTQETKSSSQAVLDNGGAMGLLNDITGGLAMTVKDAVEASVLFTKSQKISAAQQAITTTVIGTSTGAMKAFRIALASTGVGLLVVGLGLLVANFDKVKDAISKFIPGLASVGEFIGNIVDNFTDFIGITSEAERAMESLAKQADKSLAINKKFLQEEGDLVNKYTKAKIDAKNAYNNAIKEDGANQIALAKKLNRELESIDKLHNEDLEKNIKQSQDKITQKFNEELNKRIELFKQSLSNTNKEVDIITDAAKSTKDLLNSFKTTGPIESQFNLIGETLLKTTEAGRELNEQIIKLDKDYNAIKKPTKEITDEYEKQKVIFKETKGEFDGYIKNVKELYTNTIASTNEQNIGIIKQIKSEEEIYNLKLKSIQLGLQLYEFEKSMFIYGDNRLDNSNKFLEIENRIIESSKLRKSLIQETLGLENEKNKQNLEKAREANKEATKEYQEKKKLAELPSASTEDIEAEVSALGKLLQVTQNFLNADTTYKKTSNDLKLELAAETANTELAIEENTLNRKTALREEDLERQKMYAESAIGIVEETASFLDSIAALGGKKSQDFAKAALLLQKGAGVAKVVISTQEEIRGIWANPALTALPDTGVAKKTLLTAGAIARSAVSVGTILSQKVNTTGGGSAGAGGAGAGGTGGSDVGPQAQFNIVGSSQTNQLAASIAAQQNQTVNAYVVGTDVSTQQALDRNKVTNATFLVLLPFIGLFSIFIV